MTEAMCSFNVAGPKSRDFLQRLTDTSMDTADFPFMRSKLIKISGVDCVALRVSFTGDLGWELHCKTEDQLRLYEALIETGKAVGAGPVGARALMSLRVEKGYGSWSREYSPEYWPQEFSLSGLIKLSKIFLHKDAYIAIKDNPPREILSIVEIFDITVADATGGEPIFDKVGTGVGRVTSGNYGYGVNKSLALCYLKNVSPRDEVNVMVLGMPHRAIVLSEPPFDPHGTKLRG